MFLIHMGSGFEFLSLFQIKVLCYECSMIVWFRHPMQFLGTATRHRQNSVDCDCRINIFYSSGVLLINCRMLNWATMERLAISPELLRILRPLDSWYKKNPADAFKLVGKLVFPISEKKSDFHFRKKILFDVYRRRKCSKWRRDKNSKQFFHDRPLSK